MFFLNLRENLWELVDIVFRYIDLSSKFCTKIITKPKANSTAENIKKKNVNDKRLTLSNIKPTSSTIIYNDIHNNSAVNNKCKAVLTFSMIVKKKIKNKIKTKFKSPNIIYYMFIT